MKRLFPIFLLIVLGFSACTTGEGSKYAGKYTGTFTFIKDGHTKDGSVRITNNPLSQNGVLLYACLPLEYVSTGVYKANSDNVEYMKTILEAIVGGSNYIDATSEVVKNIQVETMFSGNYMEMTVYYTIQILSTLQTRVEIINFSGTR
ncbi:MAG: hypothetical protein IKQ75_07090 [Bacteroidales bacterium]|nr:hypothetical protein [Bacteroidales bacterium]MBR6161615.1 hypothetical protein [Bacteroidales bacterium]